MEPAIARFKCSTRNHQVLLLKVYTFTIVLGTRIYTKGIMITTFSVGCFCWFRLLGFFLTNLLKTTGHLIKNSVWNHYL